MIDFKAIATAALARIESLLDEWAPGGKVINGNYVCKNPVRDEENPSFSVSLESGAWYDHATQDGGGDLISLYGYTFGCNNGHAARELARKIGFALPEWEGGAQRPIQVPPPAPAVSGMEAPKPPPKQATPWTPMLPVPADAGPYPVAHIKRGRPERFWEYRDQQGGLLGVIYRFKNSTGGKEILPCVFAEHSVSGVREWRWIAFPTPRPLYMCRPMIAGRKVLMVEGEKCVDAATVLFGERFNVVTWPGGAGAVGKVDFSLITDMEVILWPDCDSQKDKKTQELLPAEKQPGNMAMEKIAQILVNQGCEVRIVDVPPPGEKPEGWDISDAISDDKWTEDDCLEFIRARLRKPVCTAAPVAPVPLGDLPLPEAGAGPGSNVVQLRPVESGARHAPQSVDDAPIDWGRLLWKKPNGYFEECKENVFRVLQAHPDWQGVIGYDLFSARIMKRLETPFGSPPGEWLQEDDDLLGLWLLERIGLLIKSADAIVRGVSMVAHKNSFHPLRDYLEGLKWDGIPRTRTWLKHAFAADTAGPDDLVRRRRERYMELAGEIFLICMVRIPYEPGSHYCLILEGLQGEGKSKALRALGGEWFCDTPFTRVGDQNSYMAIQGAWLYEVAELDAFNRSDTTAIKAFMTQPVDRYREPYERRMKDRPRQTVFSGTTNNQEYLKDETGNRRFFPVLCRTIDQAWLIENRDQLFAEALHAWRSGVKPYPSRDDERTYFMPEQQEREIGDPWTEMIYRYLNEDAAGVILTKVTTYDLLTKAINMTGDKIDGNRSMATRVGKSMTRLGWGQGRESKGARERFYTRPGTNVGDDKGAASDEDNNVAL